MPPKNSPISFRRQGRWGGGGETTALCRHSALLICRDPGRRLSASAAVLVSCRGDLPSGYHAPLPSIPQGERLDKATTQGMGGDGPGGGLAVTTTRPLSSVASHIVSDRRDHNYDESALQIQQQFRPEVAKMWRTSEALPRRRIAHSVFISVSFCFSYGTHPLRTRRRRRTVRVNDT